MFLSDKQRNEVCIYQTSNLYTFKYTRDLSGTVIVKYPSKTPKDTRPSEQATAILEFSFYWINETYPLLNGFNGLDCVRFEFE